MAKRIGIPGYSLGENSFGIGKAYAAFIAQFGIPVILTPQHEVEELDLLLLPGGADIAPSRYGVPDYYTGQSNPMLEYFDKVMLPQYIGNDTAIVSVCRGAQSLWSLYGGDIVQHNDWHETSDHNTQEVHELAFVGEYLKYSTLIDKVNSRHHQTMDATHSIPEDLDPITYAKVKGGKTKDGKIQYWRSIVESFKHKTKKIYAVQWHPEDCFSDRMTSKVIRAYLNKEDFFN